ncbi:MAG: ABC transporter ATP-binding protein/permease [Oscillospiraceae bacterium]|nr:ABC transporter ATP-binding protein/permease [Oscillospiraceae bacterium]
MMIKILRYLRKSGIRIFVIFCLLIIQAYCDLALPELNAKMIDNYVTPSVAAGQLQIESLWAAGGEMLAMAFVIMATSVVVSYLSAMTAATLGMDVRNSVFEKVLSFGSCEMDKFSTASLITRSTNDIQQIQMVLVILLRMILYAPILGIGGIIKVTGTRTGLGWIIGVSVGLLLVIVTLLVAVAMPKFKKTQVLIDRLNLVTREILTGLPVIRAFGREKHEERRFEEANKGLMSNQLFTNMVMSFMSPIMLFIMNAIAAVIIWFGGMGVERGDLLVGDMIAFITYTMQIVMSFLMLTMISVLLPRASVAAGRVMEIIETEPSVVNHHHAAAKGITHGNIRFENVSFKYGDAAENAVENISFEARAGMTTAIVGSTGSGKSTIVNLIPRFFDVTEGSITIDGFDLRALSLEYIRENIGIVPQKSALFSGSIEENLRFGKQEATEAEIIKAAETAQAAEFISENEAGYGYELSQGGSNVSGGQKQRLSIARAIVKNPKVYIFDDSFSALDYKTDADLRAALLKDTKDAAVIIVAQRIGTIRKADKIIVLDDGKVAGEGSHQQLMEDCEVYRQIAYSQLSEEELGMGGKGAL